MTAKEIAKKIRKIADDPEVKQTTLILPPNDVGLPQGIFILANFLRYIAVNLEKTKK